MPDPMEDNEQEAYLLRLEECLRLHAIDATIFIPFVIERLSSESGNHSAELWVRLKMESAREERTVRVRVLWDAQSGFTLPAAVQERVLTEWAALGVACALLPALTGMRVLSVALEGERFDYRVGNGVTEWGLEVSGTLTEDEGELRERLRLKIRQLHDNPFDMMGYVVVVGFVRREVLISLPDVAMPQGEETA
jgi:hypothetical protein